MKSLKELQEALLTVIVNPARCNEGAEDFIKDIEEPGKLSRLERVAIYGEAFYGRLHQIMEMEYPALHHALEDDLFHYFITDYLKKYPPSSYTLTDLGKKFPGFLKETRPLNNDEEWPDFIIELAVLERTFQEVFNSEGTDDLDIVRGESFEQISNEENSVLLDCRFPVHEYFLAFRKDKTVTDIPEPKKLNVLVYRRNYQVRLMSLLLEE